MSNIADKINEFRKANGVEPIWSWNPIENNHCWEHALHMTRCKELVHTPDYLLAGKAEAVGKSDFIKTTEDTVSHIIFEGFGKSKEGHREILLMPNLSFGVYVDNWQVYLCIRGWN